MRKESAIAAIFIFGLGLTASYCLAETTDATSAGALNGLLAVPSMAPSDTPADASATGLPVVPSPVTDADSSGASLPPSSASAVGNRAECHWGECLWLPGIFEASTAERKGLNGTCEARAKSLVELDITHFATPVSETHSWVLTQPGPLVDQALHLREQSGCASWPAGFERIAGLDGAVGSTCPVAAAALAAPDSATSPAVQSSRGALNKCLSALFLFRATLTGLLHGEDALDSFQDPQTVVQVFQSELYSESPRLDRLTGLLDRFLTILPGDVPALSRLSSLYFAAWAKNPTPANKANLDHTVSRLEPYTLALGDLYHAELERTLADKSAMAMRQWALKLAEAGLGADTSPYFLAWSAYLDGDRNKAQRYLRDALAKPNPEWELQTRVGLKRLLTRDKEEETRPIFSGPSIHDQLSIPIAAASLTVKKETPPWTPGASVIAGGGESISLYANDIEQHPDLEEVKEAQTEIRDHSPRVRTDLEDFLYTSTIAAIEKGHNSVAKASLEELTAIDPDNPAILNLSRALVLADKLRTNPGDSDSALLLGQIWYQEKQYGAAALQMRALLAHHPEDARAQASFHHFQNLSDWEERLQTEIKVRPQSERSLYRYACFLFREQRWEDTEKVLNNIATIAPDSARATLMRRKIQEIIQMADPAKRTAAVYAFLSTALNDPDLAFPRALAGEMLGF